MAEAPRRRPLTRLAQERVAAVVKTGDLAVDATVGNGHDTLFLAEQVGADGHVWGFDVQQDALQQAARRLADAELSERATLLHCGHEQMIEQLPPETRGQVAAVMFNLGYLPGSNKQVTTLPRTTLKALSASLELLRPGGLLSVLAYRGHAGGQHEADAVSDWLTGECSDSLTFEAFESPGPLLYLATKR